MRGARRRIVVRNTRPIRRESAAEEPPESDRGKRQQKERKPAGRQPEREGERNRPRDQRETAGEPPREPLRPRPSRDERPGHAPSESARPGANRGRRSERRRQAVHGGTERAPPGSAAMTRHPGAARVGRGPPAGRIGRGARTTARARVDEEVELIVAAAGGLEGHAFAARAGPPRASRKQKAPSRRPPIAEPAVRGVSAPSRR